ncbi:MAG: vWA domain-containing protein [Spirochaetia bacterium]
MKACASFVLVSIAAVVFVVSGFSAGAAAPKPRVEVTFVLDSTGSMGGLIDGAKEKIWSIANDIIARKPTPEVRIGLVTYRDKGDEYVTRRFDLTEDIDSVYRNLQSITADGGGDDPESVNQALHEAVTDLGWTPGPKVLKIIFLVGDYPPHMDYPDDVKYPVTAREAVKQGIIIDTVQCGDVAETAAVWKEIARRADGSYVALAQSGNMTAMTTPFDDEIARASAEIGSTVIPYGDSTRQKESLGKVAKASAAPASVAADRAAYNLASGGKAIQGTGDLLEDSKDGKVDVDRLRAEELPPEMQRMTPAARKASLAALQAKRDTLNVKLAELSKKRADYIEKERARLMAAGGGDAFDIKVTQIIAEQAARVK